MSQRRVVVYAEGESARGAGLPPAAGVVLTETNLGVPHILVRRALAFASRVPEEAIRFEAGLRSRRGLLLHGSRLLDRGELRRALAWPRAEMRPDVVVVLVDRDGEAGRYRELREAIGDHPTAPPAVIGVATEEIEAWLVGDPRAVKDALKQDWTLGAPESLKPRAARDMLRQLVAQHPDALAEPDIRRTLASTVDLDVLVRGSKSFEQLVTDLRGV